MTEAITREMKIADIVRQYPSAAETLLEYGIHCVGCRVSQFETLEQGLTGHGLTPEQVDEVVTKLNGGIPETKGDENLTITDKAVGELKRILVDKGKEGYGLRVGVMAGGCSGHQYGFDLENEERDGDTVLELDGVKFYVDKESMPLLKGAKIDYVDALQGAGFKITNPNAQRTCGCGQSFG